MSWVNACRGYTQSNGGLNLVEFKKELIKKFSDPNDVREISQGKRVDLQKYCSQLLKTEQGPIFQPTNQSRHLLELSGPYSFYFYPNILGKRVLLLGESHDIKNLCEGPICETKLVDCPTYEVHEWLRDLAQYAPDCLDIFLELPYRVSPTQLGGASLRTFSDGIDAISDEFQLCLPSSNLRGSFCKKVRYHYIDLRKYWIQDFQLESPTIVIKQQLVVSDGIDYYEAATNVNRAISDLSIKYVSQRKKIFQYMLGVDRRPSNGKILLGLLDEISQNLLQKNFAYEVFDEYMNRYFQNLDKEVSKLDPQIDKKKFLETLMASYLSHGLSFLQNLPMDIYFLTRLFIVFNEKKMTRGPLYCRGLEHQKIKNAIMYGGNAHVRIYVEFFERYFGLKPTININQRDQQGNKKCIKFDRGFDFFSSE